MAPLVIPMSHTYFVPRSTHTTNQKQLTTFTFHNRRHLYDTCILPTYLGAVHTCNRNQVTTVTFSKRHFSRTCTRATPAAPTHYSVLGVDADGSSADIKRGYKNMARLYHPDLNTEENRGACTEKFIEAREAYEVLSDPDKKAKYDFALMQLKVTKTKMSVWGAWNVGNFQREAQVIFARAQRGEKVSCNNFNRASSSWGARMRHMNEQQPAM